MRQRPLLRRHQGAHRRHRSRLTTTVVTFAVVGVTAVVLIIELPNSSGSSSPANLRQTQAHKDKADVHTSHEHTAPALSSRSTRPSSDPADEVSSFFSTPAVADFLAGRGGSVTAAVYDGNSGTTFEYHPLLTDDTASIVKADILATLLLESQQSGTPLDEDDQNEATLMIEASNNDAATDLWDEAGGAAPIASFDVSAGMTDTHPDNEAWGLTTTTALDQVALVKHIAYPNALLTDNSRRYELGLMERVDAGENWGVSYGIPNGVTIALKNGWLPQANGWQINSIGFVDGDGRNYVIAVLTSGDPSESYGINTIQDLSELVWNYLQPVTSSSGPRFAIRPQ
jgi:hypothetical protein